MKFKNYYGRFDYADHWVSSAFLNVPTDFVNGGADPTVYGFDGRSQLIKKGTSYISVWMYIVREMLDAVNDCNANCGTANCNDDHVNAWDEGVAFYVGSQAKMAESGGYFPWTLAEKRCANFGTCMGTDGLSNVNSEIFEEFAKGKNLLMEKECDAVMGPTNRIIDLMTVPLIQGTLRYTYFLGKQQDDREAASAEMAVFAAAVLPRVHACSAADASTIYANTKAGTAPADVDFDAVKLAFENNYDCLGITCADVGGLLAPDSDGFLPDAAPCGGVTDINPTSAAPSTTLLTTLSASFMAMFYFARN